MFTSSVSKCIFKVKLNLIQIKPFNHFSLKISVSLCDVIELIIIPNNAFNPIQKLGYSCVNSVACAATHSKAYSNKKEASFEEKKLN